MHVFIDEAGSFIIPAKPNYISCVVALMIPSAKRQYLFDRFLQLRTSWGSKSAEIKGSTLHEKQVAIVIKELAKYEALVQIFGIDGSKHSVEGITDFKLKQADKLTEHIGLEHHPNMVVEMKKLQEQLRNTSNQLFIQTFFTTLLIEHVLEGGTLYWSQRSPGELGEFVWTIDAKDRTITAAEKMWRTLLLPFLETRSMTHSLPTCDDPHFDYSQFDNRFAGDASDENWKDHFEWLEKERGLRAKNRALAIDIKKIMSELRFANSAEEVGLQLADIVASAFQRACKGTLQKDGWKDLGSLFTNKRESIVHLVALGPERFKGPTVRIDDEQVQEVLVSIRTRARSMLTF